MATYQDITNNLYAIAQIKDLLMSAINRLVPNGITSATPFANYPTVLNTYTPSGGVNRIVTEDFSNWEGLNHVKIYKPAVIEYNTSGTTITTNEGWGYDTTKGYYNPIIGDSESTKIVFRITNYNSIVNPSLANEVPISIYQSSETYYDGLMIYASSDGTTEDTFLANCKDISGSDTVNLGVSTFPDYLIFKYEKDGGTSSGEDRCYFKFTQGTVTQTIISQEEVYYTNVNQ